MEATDLEQMTEAASAANETLGYKMPGYNTHDIGQASHEYHSLVQCIAAFQCHGEAIMPHIDHEVQNYMTLAVDSNAK
ncbi:Uncharacterised protein [BD1-7 clade bacterium]|uniref:Uncharacterized protein n=1 Tax=BD1-7 clade bacterium TaxID=2029982 RepID=A0A5S9QHE5_9GAMM|nr:Uncharacterised protein [BD1-7 clade bacterium]CAA0117301.1 Uncharacterised protein [BD1-7 clade bacterium]